jgi:hypothetical protein
MTDSSKTYQSGVRFRAQPDAPVATIVVVPKLFSVFNKRRLGILLLQGEIEFDDCAAKHLVLRHEIAIKALALGRRGPNVLLDAPVLSYQSKDGRHREVRVHDTYDAEYEGEGRWRLKDGKGFHIRQVSLERGTDERGAYLAPVIISFSNGDHCAGSAQYRPDSGRVHLDEEVLEEIERLSDRYFNNIVESVYVEIAGAFHKTQSGKGREFFIPSEGLNEELAFGTHLKDVQIPAPTFVSFNTGTRTPVINWNPTLLFGVSRVDHQSDGGAHGTFGGAGAIYIGNGRWQQDSAESFYLYDKAGNLWTPQRRDLR